MSELTGSYDDSICNRIKWIEQRQKNNDGHGLLHGARRAKRHSMPMKRLKNGRGVKQKRLLHDANANGGRKRRHSGLPLLQPVGLASRNRRLRPPHQHPQGAGSIYQFSV